MVGVPAGAAGFSVTGRRRAGAFSVAREAPGPGSQF